jgi:hypothetical protein
VSLSDELAERLQDYARAHAEQPEDALTQLVSESTIATIPVAPSATNAAESEGVAYPGPRVGVRGRFTADSADLLTNHDAYLAKEATPHQLIKIIEFSIGWKYRWLSAEIEFGRSLY